MRQFHFKSSCLLFQAGDAVTPEDSHLSEPDYQEDEESSKHVAQNCTEEEGFAREYMDKKGFEGNHSDKKDLPEIQTERKGYCLENEVVETDHGRTRQKYHAGSDQKEITLEGPLQECKYQDNSTEPRRKSSRIQQKNKLRNELSHHGSNKESWNDKTGENIQSVINKRNHSGYSCKKCLRKALSNPRSRYQRAQRISSVVNKRLHEQYWIRQMFIRVTQDRKNVYECSKCKRVFQLLALARIHYVIVHAKTWSCQICKSETKIKFKSQRSLRLHQRKQHGAKQSMTRVQTLQCSYCSRKFLYEKNLNQHEMVLHMNDKPKSEKCRSCGKIYTYQRNSDTDRTSGGSKDKESQKSLHHSTSVQEYPKICTIKDGKYPHQCTKCDANYARKIPLKKHMMQCHGISITEWKNPLIAPKRINADKKTYQCEECTEIRTFQTYAELNRHLIDDHTKVNYKCTVAKCSYKSRIHSKFDQWVLLL